MKDNEKADVAIIGGGPAGLEAAIVLSRTRKRTVVFDAPSRPRNGASHGVHNALGLEGSSPARVREVGWEEIRAYRSAELRRETVVDVTRAEGGGFWVSTAEGTRLAATKILLAFGFRDRYPDIPGFEACWANTVFPCPFCDGFENRDRAWGIVGGPEKRIMELVPMSRNWTQSLRVFTHGSALSPENRAALARRGIAVHDEPIVRLDHEGGKLTAVTLGSKDRIAVGSLLWSPDSAPVPLVGRLVEHVGLAVDEHGFIKTDDAKATNVDGIWAAGDVQGWAGAVGAVQAGQVAAVAMVRHWYA